ncbi:hypothetical protein QN372_00265 [Undibacterium sp. RTI2.1]|uniref:hypothetical protein n=1 Tax=unclassified Undibacterium TaxID=2630295 RepID=UPI002AB34714|nr:MULTISPECIES: hypothetical protein [unclassified Undibacterium]MDY7537572.1 hypothetical protein [Undibacterium sp. 5I1]MEB0029172.1 hypothetical protein [Undibacterium sp. RTI2.1]MEB0115480.1 hypothetical protein [Undibacterium sp. RTI2.2]MEB0231957.1 hypothetical protein [Undibacterium sp. 10I3]MEB0256308.1 hypothetical protein [Undibacterium sp. 5I1]
MIHTIFEWRENREYGEEGWILKGFPNFNASSGRGVAHDTLEHFKDGDGSLADEMMAFGAMLHIRGESGWFASLPTRDNRLDKQMGFDIARFLQELRSGNVDLRKPPRTYRLKDADLESDLFNIIKEGVKEANQGRDNDAEIFQPGLVTDKMIHWMRVGYRKALKRFKGNKPHDIAYCFDTIANRVDLGFDLGDIGDELHVCVNTESLAVKIYSKEIY